MYTKTDQNGNKRYYNDQQQLHQDDGPAIEYSVGSKAWYQHDQCHREDGPAVELASGDKFWYQYDKLHREDGPAVEYANGSKEWFLQGQLINVKSQQEFERYLKLKAFW